MESLRSQVASTQKSKESELSSLKTALRELQRSHAEKVRELARKSKEVEELRSSLESHVSAVERRYSDEAALFRKRSGTALLSHVLGTVAR
jgi:soluble cytochrome b562